MEARLRAARRQHRGQRGRRVRRDRDDARAPGARHPLLDLVSPRDRRCPTCCSRPATVLVELLRRGHGASRRGARRASRAGAPRPSSCSQPGHRRIAFVNTTTPSPARTGRLAGYRDALEAAGIDVRRVPRLLRASLQQEGGYAAAHADRRVGRHRGVLPQRPGGDGPVRRAARARACAFPPTSP